MVDATIIFDGDTPLDLIKQIRPDVLIKAVTTPLIMWLVHLVWYGGTVLLALWWAEKFYRYD